MPSTASSSGSMKRKNKKTTRRSMKKIGPKADGYQAGTDYDEHKCLIKTYNIRNWNALTPGNRNYFREQKRLKELQQTAATTAKPPPPSPPPSLSTAKTAEELFKALLSASDSGDDDDGHHAATSIDMEGISKLAEAIGLDAETDLRVLVLVWKLNGGKEKPGEISKTEFMDGCDKLKVRSLSSFKSLLPSLDTGFLDRDGFKGFYKFCFQFNLEGTHRTIDKELLIEMLKMVLKDDRIPNERLNTFCEFAEEQSSYSRFTLDQWTSFLDFCYECEDLSKYDESGSAWPVLIDEYVDYMEEKQTKKTK